MCVCVCVCVCINPNLPVLPTTTPFQVGEFLLSWANRFLLKAGQGFRHEIYERKNLIKWFLFTMTSQHLCVNWKTKKHNMRVVQVVLSCPTLCDPMDCSPPGSSVHGILQARTLERVAVPRPGDPPSPRDRTKWSPTWQADSLTSEPPGKYLGQMRTTAQERAFQAALRNCSAEAEGRSVYIWFQWVIGGRAVKHTFW